MIVQEVVYIANVGDSRAILSSERGKRLFLLSRDHKPDDALEAERIEKHGGSVYQNKKVNKFT